MSIPSRTEAISVAQENISIDAARYEALLMVWDGATEIRLDVPGHDAHIVPQLVKSLKDSGFAARSVVRANVTKDWIVYFK
jgi:hypothetical protein